MDREKVLQCVKSICDSDEFNIDFNEIEVNFKIATQIISVNYFIIRDTIEIKNKNNNNLHFSLSCDKDIDSEEIIARDVLKGYLCQKRKFLEKEEKKKSENKFRKDHPILSFFKKWYFWINR